LIITNVEEKNVVAQISKRSKSRGVRRTVSLNSGLEKSLSAYVTAAVAAGVNLLVMANTVEAKIIYTPALTNIPVSDKEPILLDLNHDGIADFSLWNVFANGDQGEFFRTLAVGCEAVPKSSSSNTCRYKSNMVWGQGAISGRFASALHAGFRVRPDRPYFQQGQRIGKYSYPPTGPVALMATYAGASISAFPTNRTGGQWLHTKHRYLGLQFTIAGQIHYGWARVAVSYVNAVQSIEATLTGYAYETIPNKPIITGKTKGPDVVTFEPASLGHLAQGAFGIPVWRKSGGNWKSVGH
jgi:hypothetical protein